MTLKPPGVALGIATVAPIVPAVLRPLARTLIKQSLLLLERARERVADAVEAWDEIVAEARAEAAAARRRRSKLEDTKINGYDVDQPEPIS